MGKKAAAGLLCGILLLCACAAETVPVNLCPEFPWYSAHFVRSGSTEKIFEASGPAAQMGTIYRDGDTLNYLSGGGGEAWQLMQRHLPSGRTETVYTIAPRQDIRRVAGFLLLGENTCLIQYLRDVGKTYPQAYTVFCDMATGEETPVADKYGVKQPVVQTAYLSDGTLFLTAYDAEGPLPVNDKTIYAIRGRTVRRAACPRGDVVGASGGYCFFQENDALWAVSARKSGKTEVLRFSGVETPAVQEGASVAESRLEAVYSGWAMFQVEDGMLYAKVWRDGTYGAAVSKIELATGAVAGHFFLREGSLDEWRAAPEGYYAIELAYTQGVDLTAVKIPPLDYSQPVLRGWNGEELCRFPPIEENRRVWIDQCVFFEGICYYLEGPADYESVRAFRLEVLPALLNG